MDTGQPPAGEGSSAALTVPVSVADDSATASIMPAAVTRQWSRALIMRASLETTQKSSVP
jgi:hypothetical protein